MELAITIIAFILIFGLLVFVHELGHFVVARRNGIKVEEFAFGLPLLPAIFRTKRGETEYSIYPVPLGGFVRMLGEDGGSKSKRSFAAKPAGVRAKVLVAGVVMNLLLAYVLLTVALLAGMKPLALCASDYPNAKFDNSVTIAAISKNGPAATAGLQTGDVLRSIDGEAVRCHRDVPKLLTANAGQPIAVAIERAGQAQTLTVTPGADGVSKGKIGIGPADNYTKLEYPWWEAPYLALLELGAMTTATLAAIGGLFASLLLDANVPAGLAGPVGIAKLTGVAVDLGPVVVLQFVATLSLSLAIFNILPIPALDGGRLLFVLIEQLRGGRPVSSRFENSVHAAGFIFLIGLILVVSYFDITR